MSNYLKVAKKLTKCETTIIKQQTACHGLSKDIL